MARLPRLGVAAIATAGALALGLAAVGPVSAKTSSTASTASTGSAYTAMSPVRILDTRASGGPLGANTSMNLPVETTASGVPSDATAIAANITVTDTTDSSYLSAYPTGGSQPYVSNLNWVKGETVANASIVPIGSNGDITLYNHTGSTQVIVDVDGYFAPPSGNTTSTVSGAYVPLTPSRITDTRTGSGKPNAGSTLGPKTNLTVQATGVGGVPAGATGVLVNLTAVNTTAASYLTAYPTGTTMPTASNLNWTAGETVANRALVELNTSGQFNVYNYAGNTDVVVDIDGYFTNGTSTVPSNASLYSPITPTRLLDTRVSGGTLGAGGTDNVLIAGVAGIPSDATAGVTNVTAVNTTAASYFTVYPAGATRPTASDVNWTAGQIVPNLTVATLGSNGEVTVYNYAGSADLVVDAFGYFAPYVPPVISVSSNPSSVPENTAGGTLASGSQSIITAYLASNANGDSILYSTNGAAACGGFGGTTGTTTVGSESSTDTQTVAAGTTSNSVQYDAGTATGACVITATEAASGASASTTVTTVAPTNSVSLGAASPTTTSGAQDLLTATVSGPSAASDAVTFSTSGTCGSVAPTTATTPASGTEAVNAYYTGATTSGYCTITAKEANTGASSLPVVIDTTTAGTDETVTVTPSTATLTANGTSTQSFTATLSNGSGTAPVGIQVMFTVVKGTATNCGTVSPTFATTGTSGTASTTYTTSSSTGTCTVTAQEAQSGHQGTATVTQTAPTAATDTVTSSPNPLDVTAGSGNSSTITVTVDTSSGTPVDGAFITYTTTGTCGGISPASGTAPVTGTAATGTQTGSNGTAIFTYTAPAAADGGTYCQITFSEATQGPSSGGYTVLQSSSDAGAPEVVDNQA